VLLLNWKLIPVSEDASEKCVHLGDQARLVSI
jgi:hypothetical protein